MQLYYTEKHSLSFSDDRWSNGKLQEPNVNVVVWKMIG